MIWLEIAERAEKAMGPDRELDTTVYEAADIRWPYEALPYTASVDAMLALIAQNLPGWAVGSIQEKLRGCIGYIHNNEMAHRGIGAQPNPVRQWYECRAATQPLALLAAFARAMASLPNQERAA